ncbi:MAG: fumarylacetoacetate hydrolase family protein [Burkholderiales bacterium]|nr:fumarylacetoacetate hydrolase family protein [Burkholderiales bacterium]
MTRWIRFEHEGRVQFGTLEGETIRVHEGDMFAGARDTGRTVGLEAVKLLTPCVPTKMVALWNNYRALAEKLGQATPPEPLWFIKANSSFHPGGQPIRVPASYAGKVIYEGELGIVIGKRTARVSEAEAPAHIFGYTCINDVTAVELLKKDASFDQWSRSKSFDTFGVFGPVIATGLDPAKLVIRTMLNGQERQNYPASDMFFGPAQLVSLISQDLTFEAGDVICCGTSVGVGSMKPGSDVVVSIEGIGELANRFE